jgi:hypothetical protein
MPILARAIDGGYGCYPVMAQDPWLESVRSRADFQTLLAIVRTRWEHATARFTTAGGPAILGIGDGRSSS